MPVTSEPEREGRVLPDRALLGLPGFQNDATRREFLQGWRLRSRDREMDFFVRLSDFGADHPSR